MNINFFNKALESNWNLLVIFLHYFVWQILLFKTGCGISPHHHSLDWKLGGYIPWFWQWKTWFHSFSIYRYTGLINYFVTKNNTPGLDWTFWQLNNIYHGGHKTRWIPRSSERFHPESILTPWEANFYIVPLWHDIQSAVFFRSLKACRHDWNVKRVSSVDLG